MLVYYKIKFHNGQIKEYKTKSPIDDAPVYTLNFYMLQRHIDKGQVIKELLRNDGYFIHPAISQQLIIERFKAEILESRLLDGRTKEAKKLPWFSMEEFIANY